jgi:U3 small nucleolar RNA-associated protein 18
LSSGGLTYKMFLSRWSMPTPQIDGHTNTSLLSLHIPSLPIKTMQFHPSGSSILLTGSRPFYYTYDLRSQRCIRSSKTLLSNASASDPGSTYSMDKTVFSPDGSVLAIAGRRGIVTLLAWGPGGSGQLLTTLKSGRTGGVQDMMWRNGGKELWVLGEGSEVDVWDLGERRCIARWKDQGGFGGKLLRGSRNGDYCAVA